MNPLDEDARRTTSLILSREIESGQLAVESVAPTVRAALRPRRVPTRVVRLAQRARTKILPHDGFSAQVGAAVAARRAALGKAAAGPARFLVRLDDFPHMEAHTQPDVYGTDAMRRLHDVMVEAGVPYLLAVVPRPAHDYLSLEATGVRDLAHDESELLRRMKDDGVELGQHGTTHRTRAAKPQHRTELGGLSADALGVLLDEGRLALEELGVRPRVLVPPFNRFEARQWPTLSHRYEVITGGPETIACLGLRRGPAWRGDAVYLPCYAPLYGTAREMSAAVERAVVLQPGTWVAVTLHLGWEADDGFHALRRLVSNLAPYAVSWQTFLGAVEQSRGVAPSATATAPG